MPLVLPKFNLKFLKNMFFPDFFLCFLVFLHNFRQKMINAQISRKINLKLLKSEGIMPSEISSDKI